MSAYNKKLQLKELRTEFLSKVHGRLLNFYDYHDSLIITEGDFKTHAQAAEKVLAKIEIDLIDLLDKIRDKLDLV